MTGGSSEIVEMLIHAVCRKLVGRTNRLEKLWERTVIISSFGRAVIRDMMT